MISELNIENYNDKNLEKIRKRLNKAFENASTEKEFREFQKRQLKFQKERFGKLTDPTTAPFWDGTFYAKTPDEWKMAIALLIHSGFPAKSLSKMYKEEMSHYKKAIAHNLHAIFVMRFCYHTDGSIIFEPAVMTYDYNPDTTYGNKIIDVADIPESSSEWDKKTIEMSKNFNKKSKRK